MFLEVSIGTEEIGHCLLEKYEKMFTPIAERLTKFLKLGKSGSGNHHLMGRKTINTGYQTTTYGIKDI